MSSLTFLSWNLAMLERSEFAPAGWRLDQSEAAVRNFVLQADTDLVLFQELPGLIPYIDTHDMAPANAKGQLGDIATLARRALMPDITASRVKYAVLTHVQSMDLTIANIHLPSGNGGDEDRLKALESIQAACPTKHLAIIGDSNTRTKEEPNIAKLGLMGERPPAPTWDGHKSKYRRDDHNFSAYFTRGFHSKGVTIDEVKVWSTPVQDGDHAFHLSDHFALSGRITINHTKS